MELFNKKTKIKLAVMLVCAVLAAGVIGGTLAAYNRQAYARGVAANIESETVRFTSNYLQNCESKSTAYPGRTVLFSENDKKENTLSIDVSIYNYANNNTEFANQSDIKYTLTVTFSGGSGTYYLWKYGTADNEKITLPKEDGSYTASMTSTLLGRSAHSDTYRITFPASELNQVKITAVAEPENYSATGNQLLAAVLAPGTAAAVAEFSAKGNFVYENGTQPRKYNGYNYEISISSGTANAVLTWDNTALEIDPFFLKKVEEATIEDAGNGKKQLKFKMDQPNGTGDFMIPFYIVDKEKIPSGWDAMEKLVTFMADKAKSE